MPVTPTRRDSQSPSVQRALFFYRILFPGLAAGSPQGYYQSPFAKFRGRLT